MKRHVVSIGLILALASGAAFAGLSIDSFDYGDNNYVWLHGGAGTWTGSVSHSSILGGQLDMTLDVAAGYSYNPSVSAGFGFASYSSTYQNVATWTLEYGKSADLNADFASAGSAIGLLDLSGDMDDSIVNGPVPIDITIRADGVEVTRSYQFEDDGDHLFPLSDFAGLNLSSVDYLKFSLYDMDTNDGTDYSFGQLAVVPAPGAMLLGVIGLGAVRAIRRRLS